MNVPKGSKLHQIFPAQGVGSNGHCVGSGVRTEIENRCFRPNTNYIFFISTFSVLLKPPAGYHSMIE